MFPTANYTMMKVCDNNMKQTTCFLNRLLFTKLPVMEEFIIHLLLVFEP